VMSAPPWGRRNGDPLRDPKGRPSSLAIYDVSGRLWRRSAAPNGQQVRNGWCGMRGRKSGARVASGVYLGRLRTPDGEQTVKLVRVAE